METKFTKGKLEINKDEFQNNIVCCDGFYLAEFRNEYDAKIFSKAPEMFELLNNLAYGDISVSDAIEQSKQLLKEATEL